jgi:putative tricarboxylic transport membrane protein
VMRRTGWPRPPVVLGFVLGPIMETNLDLSLQAFGWAWLGRTWVLAMLAVLALALARPVWRLMRGLWAQTERSAAKPVEAPAHHPATSAALAAVLTLVFAGAWLLARPWSTDASFFPNVITVCGFPLAALAVGADLWRARAPDAGPPGDARAVLAMFGMLAGMVALSLLIGQKVAIPITVALFLWLWAHERWIVVLAQALGAILILEFVFDRLLHPIWIEPVIRVF